MPKKTQPNQPKIIPYEKVGGSSTDYTAPGVSRHSPSYYKPS